LGAAPASVVILLAGSAFAFAVSTLLGFVAKASEGSVDRPVFDWVYPRVHDSLFTRLQEKLTFMGNNPIVQVVGLIAVIVLAAAFRRRWWLPVVAVGAAYFVEHYVQKALGTIVDRGHPPTPLGGTFPSGGVARILSVYGVIVALVLLASPHLSRAWRAGLWTGLATAALIESYTRVYLSRHWLTDAAFGLPFGALLLLSNVTALAALAAHEHREEPVPSGELRVG
jgi:hypothetical protein